MNWHLFFVVILKIDCSIGKAPLGNPSTYNSLPNTINLVLRYSRTNYFTFRLEKISDDVEKAKVVVGNDEKIHVSPRDPNTHFSMYKDTKFDATFTVAEHRTNDSYVGYIYYGSFAYGWKWYSLEPTHPNDTTVKNELARDYIVTIDSVRYHLRESLETSQGGNDVNYVTPDDTTSHTVNQYKKGNKKRFIGDKQLLTLEILVILDYSIYSKWLNLMDGNEDQAIKNVVFYFTEVISVVKMKYEHIDTPKYKFTVTLAGFYIAETPEMVPFLQVAKGKRNAHTTKDSILLQELAQWVDSMRQFLPRFDLAALYTTEISPGFLGFGYIAGVCSFRGVSINRDLGHFKSGDTTAHEIGHNLGANHDGEGNECRYVDHHVMVSGKGPLTEANYNNTFYFSKCSVKYFLARIYQMNRLNINCLEDYPETSVPLDTSKLFSGSVGQKLSPNEQCKIVLGPTSHICSKGKGDTENMCFAINCKAKDGRCYPVIPAFGTSCGKKRWCVKGKCIRDEKAPEFRDYCLLGDSTDLIETSKGSKTCKELINQNPKYCGDTYYKDQCCETCGKLKDSGNKNCPFGDQNINCDTKYCSSPYYRIGCCKTCQVSSSENLPKARCEDEDRTPICRNPNGHRCYSDHDLCCVGCAKIYNETDRGCEYGDKNSWCYDRIKEDPSNCKSEHFSKPCCRSCKLFGGKIGPKKPEQRCEDKQDCSKISPWHCYKIKGKCCETCKKHENLENENCEYGDKASWCQAQMKTRMSVCADKSDNYAIECCGTCRNYRKLNKNETTEKCFDIDKDCSFTTSYNCYQYESECCETCKRFLIKENDKNCKYGDRFEWCRSYVTGQLECQDKESIEDCCQSCYPYVNE